MQFLAFEIGQIPFRILAFFYTDLKKIVVREVQEWWLIRKL